MRYRIKKRYLRRLAMLALTAGTAAWSTQSVAQQSKLALPGRNAAGQRVFASTCSGCHGLDGRGGERAPNIAEKPEVQRLSDAALTRIIEHGIPGTGMPAFRTLGISDIKAVVFYLRILQGSSKTARLPGDSERGGRIFFGEGGCSSCHTVAGRGGFIASDLSGYAHSHSMDEVRRAIVKPQNATNQQSLVVLLTNAGQEFRGRVRNEDNFSIQLQTIDGSFYFLSKSALAQVKRDSEWLTAEHGSRMNAKQVDDLASYLIKSAQSKRTESPEEHEE